MPLQLNKLSAACATPVDLTVSSLTIAGWTGRDRAALEHHIQELADLGVKRPTSTPCYYRVSPDLLTTSDHLDVVGEASSGEVEFVLVGLGGELWVGVGSDHTDRQVEAYSVTVSKQMCAKAIGRDLWRYADVARHWDQLLLRSHLVEFDGARRLYQEGSVAAMLPPETLIAGAPSARAGRLPEGAVLFCGTLSALGGIRAGSRFEFELHDPVLGRSLTHAYDIRSLAINE